MKILFQQVVLDRNCDSSFIELPEFTEDAAIQYVADFYKIPLDTLKQDLQDSSVSENCICIWNGFDGTTDEVFIFTKFDSIK